MKIENCNQFTIFVSRPKHSKSLTELPKWVGEGSIRTVIRASSILTLDPLPHTRIFFFFFLPLPPSLPSHATLLWKGRSGKFVLPRSHFSNMNDFSTEYIKDLVIIQRKTDSEMSLLLKERFPDKKGFSSRSVRRFCFENGINLRNRLSNDAVHAGRRCLGKYKFIRLRCLLFAIFFFFLPSFPCLYSRLYEHPSGFKIIFQLLA